MIVYRYEKDGIGPFGYFMADNYRTSDISSIIYKWNDTHPNYVYDCKLSGDLCKRVLCGTRSLKQLYHWFDANDRKILQENGFSIVMYDVSDDYIFHGKYQCAFYYEHAQRIEQLEMSPS